MYCVLHITWPLFFFVPFWHMTCRKPWTPAGCPHLQKQCSTSTACSSRKQKERLKHLKDTDPPVNQQEAAPGAVTAQSLPMRKRFDEFWQNACPINI